MHTNSKTTPDLDPCVDEFNQLKTLDLQRQAPKTVFASLSRQQIREMHKRVDATHFRCDIVGQLPLEINQIIAQYLPLHDIVAAQCVSHTWSRIFTTPHTLKPLLQNWYDDSDQGNSHALRIPEGLSTTFVASLKAEHVDVYRTGRAFSLRSGVWNLPSSIAITNSVAYADGILAWIDSSLGYISVRHLETGKQLRLYSQHTDVMSNIAVSTSLVLAVSQPNTCYVWESDGVQRLCPPVAPSHVTVVAVAIFDKIVVVQHDLAYSHLGQVSAGFTIWTFDALPVTPCSCSIGLHKYRIDYRQWHGTKLMFDHTGQAIVLFEVDTKPNGNTFYFTRLGINGHFQGEGRLFVSKRSRKQLSDYGTFTTASTLVDGRTVIWVNAMDTFKSGPSKTLKGTCVVYDSIHKELILKKITVPTHGNTPPQLTTSNFFWRDVAYFRGPDYKEKGTDKSTILNVIDFNEGVCREAQMTRRVDLKGLSRANKRLLPSIFFGDGRFLINCNKEMFQIWGFEKHVRLVGEDFLYKNARDAW